MIGLTTQVNDRFVSRVTSAGQDFCSQKEQKILSQLKAVILLTDTLVLRYFAATFAVSKSMFFTHSK